MRDFYAEQTERLYWTVAEEEDQWFAHEGNITLCVARGPDRRTWGWEISRLIWLAGSYTSVHIAHNYTASMAQAQWEAFRAYARYMVAVDTEWWAVAVDDYREGYTLPTDRYRRGVDV